MFLFDEPFIDGWIGARTADVPVVPGTLRNPPFGMVLHWPSANEASHSPFINRLKIATEWRSSPQSGNAQMAWADLVAGGHISPTGTVNSIPAGQDNLVMDALGYMPAESGASGRYRLFYSSTSPYAGNNIWIMGGASNTDNSVPGQIDFDYTANGSSSVTILIVGVPAPITLRALVKHDHLTNYDAGEVFDPLWLDVIRNNRVLRFGDWQRVDRYTGSAAWADRTPVDRITYDGAAGVPFEHWFAVCNLVGADPWINILSPADDTYCANLAAMARAQLGPSRRIYVELSNKVWDSTNWVTADYFRGLAVAQFGDNSVEACMEAYGGRSAEVFAIWQAEWSGADAVRLRTVLQGWTGVAHHDSFIMDAPRWVAAASGRVAPWTLATDFALQNVLDGGLRYDWMPENLAVLDGWFADLAAGSMTEQDLIEEFASALRGANPAVSGGYDIASLGANYDAHLTYLATRPLNVIAYEGGSHLCVPPARNGNATWRDFYRAFHRSPEGAAAFGDARAAFLAKFPSPETVYVYRCDVRKPDQNNSEGLYFYLGDTANNHPLTRWLADQAARQGAAGRGDDAFVGAVERPTAAPFVPAMLETYVVPELPPLPPQLLPNPAMDDPAAWTVANGWSLDGEGAVKTGTSWARLTALNVDIPDDATDLLFMFDIIAQTSNAVNGASGGVRGMLQGNSVNPKYNGYIDPYRTVPQITHIRGRVPGQDVFQVEAQNSWAGRVANAILMDASYARDRPAILVPLLGQSNIVAFGNGGISPTLDKSHPLIWSFPPVNYVQYGAIQHTASIAQEPLVHSGSPSHRLSPGMALAKKLIALTGGAYRVVLIPTAQTGVGMLGTGIQSGWSPDTDQTGANDRYQVAVDAINAAKAAIPNVVAMVMCWAGNEADMQKAKVQTALPPMFRTFCERLRADVNEPDMAIIINGSVRPVVGAETPLVTLQKTFAHDSGSPNAIEGVYYLPGPEGSQWINGVNEFTGAADTVHYTSEATRIRGDFAGQWIYAIGRDRGWWA